MIVSITGGNGFIGKRLARRHLAEGDTVRIFTRKPRAEGELSGSVRYYHGDLTLPGKEMFAFADGADLLYHCAAEINSPDLMYKVHVQGTRNLIEAASGKIGRWVQLSSVGVYGPHSQGTITEETPLNPANIYEKTKADSDKQVIDAACKGKITFSMLRPSNVFGEEMINLSLFQLISAINNGVFFFIGKRGASANYVYVENVVEGLMLCGRLPEADGRIFNLSDHRMLESFVAIISKELGRPVPKLRLPEKPVRWIAKIGNNFSRFPLTESRFNALTNRSVYSNAQIESKLGYKHLFSMEKGLERMVKVWKQCFAANANTPQAL